MSNLVIDVPRLAEQLRRAAKAYYDTDELVMSDAEYDQKLDLLRTAVADDPAARATVADLFERVAAGQSGGGDVEHPTMMGSLEKATMLDAVDSFVGAVGGPVVVEPKLDGLAIRAQYENGTLTLVATRGDGTTGEDITTRVKALRPSGLPLTLTEPVTVGVRGEIIMTDEHFPAAQAARAKLGGEPFKNPRNAAAGILRKGDRAYAELLTFGCYGLEDQDAETDPDEPDALERLGIATARGLLLGFADETNGKVFGDEELWSREINAHGERVYFTPAEYVRNVIGLVAEYRDRLGFPIDGVVIKAQRVADRQRLGEGSRAPRWAIAYKYDAVTATTKVVDITTAVGRTGRLAIRIEVEPVFVAGTTITYATGHNVAWMAEKDVRVGDTVLIKRANDVIPYIESVVPADRPADATAWQPPATDPNGGEWDKSTLLWRSTDPTLSVGSSIRYAVSRDALDIEGMGTEIVDALVEVGLPDWVELFTLSEDDLADLPLAQGRKLGSKNAVKIIAEIDKARTAPWNRIVTALGMRMTGRTMSRRIAATFPTLDALRDATVAGLAAVDGIGDVKAQVIRSELDRLAPLLDRLTSRGINTGTAPAADGPADAPLAGLTVVVSGTVPGYSRTTVQELIESLGGKASGSVSAATSLLVSDPSTSSKYLTASKLGVRIVTPAEFLAIVAR